MRPRAFFVAQVILVLALCIIILGISVFLANYLAFLIRISGHDSLLGFGSRGITTFLLVIPWKWVAVDALLIVLTVYVLRRFRWWYARPAVYLSSGLFIAALVVGFFIDEATPFNDDLLRRADHDELPAPIHALYEHAHEGAPHDQGVYRGIVSAIGTSTLTLAHDDFDHDEDDGDLTILPPAHQDLSAFHIGDRLYVAGSQVSSSTISAYGIQELAPAP